MIKKLFIFGVAALVPSLGLTVAQRSHHEGKSGSTAYMLPGVPYPQVAMAMPMPLPVHGRSTPSLRHLLSGVAPTFVSQELLSDLIFLPNPFARSADNVVISYDLRENAAISITVYDTHTQPIRQWAFAAGDPGGRTGRNAVRWHALDASGKPVAPGTYIIEVTATNSQTSTSATDKLHIR